MRGLATFSGRIIALGGTDELAAAFPGFARVDLGGRAALPGLVDSHIHLAPYGISLRRVNLAGAHSLREATSAVAAAVAREQPGSWILGRGWDKNIWPEDRFPSASDLDAVSPGTPVALSSKDGHLLWVNTAALRLAGVDRRTPDPPGGEIVRGARSEPTGILKEEATQVIWRAVPPDGAETVERGITDATAAVHRWGIVGVHNFVGADADDGSAAFAAFQRLEARATTPAQRVALDEKRAVAETWIQSMGPDQARLKARKTARALMVAAIAARADKGVPAPDVADAMALAAYWRDVCDLIVVAMPQS